MTKKEDDNAPKKNPDKEVEETQNHEEQEDLVLEEKEVLRTSPKEMSQMVEMVNAIKDSGLFAEHRQVNQAFSGPLPPQILDNLSPEQSDKIIDDMIFTNRKSIENQSKLMESVFQNEKEIRKHRRVFFFAGLFGGLGLIVFLVLTSNLPLLEKLLELGLAFVAGGGLIGFLSKKPKDESKKSPEDDDNI